MHGIVFFFMTSICYQKINTNKLDNICFKSLYGKEKQHKNPGSYYKRYCPNVSVQQRIYVIRGKQVIVDRDLAVLYGVETRVLKQAVRRNPERFPEEFMFQLDNQEFEKWRSQVVMSNADKMGLRYRPYVFTEQGVAMLSAVLKSPTAVSVSI